MEKSTNYNFNLPNSANDEIADINDISDNFRIIDETIKKTDQTYTPTSENSQSGVAVNQAIKTVADVEDTEEYKDVNFYKSHNNSTQSSLMVKLKNNGNVSINSPTGKIQLTDLDIPRSDDDAVSRYYATKIAETAVAAEEQRSNNAFANALKGSVSGSAVRMDDTSPVEHTIGVKVKSKNMFDINTATKLNGMSVFTKADNTIQVSHTSVSSWTSANIALSKSLIGKTVIVTAKAHTSGVNNAYMRIQWTDSNGEAVGNMLQSNTATGTTDTLLTLTGVVPNQPDETHPNLVLMFYSNTNAALETGITYSSTYSDIQLEEGNSATPYTPYVPDLTATKVIRYGKNLFDKSLVWEDIKDGYDLSNATFVGHSDNGWILQGNNGNGNGNSHFKNGWFRPGRIREPRAVIIPKNTVVTISADITVLEFREVANPLDRYAFGIYINENQTGRVSIQNENVTKRYSVTYTLKQPSHAIPVFTLNSNKVKIENIQIELGAEATDYDSFSKNKYTPAADGTVEGVKSLYPTTTLIPDTEGLILEADYNRDINKAFAELQQAIISTGGNV